MVNRILFLQRERVIVHVIDLIGVSLVEEVHFLLFFLAH